MNNLEIRCDDVLQVSRFTSAEKKALKEKSFFQWFLEADKLFENYPMILAVLSEGIDLEPEWVEHIKKNKHRYKIELHGLDHKNYKWLSKNELKNELSEAIKKIEDTFETKITTWYIPFGRPGKTPYGEEVCKELGIKYDVPIGKIGAKEWLRNHNLEHINFHFFCKEQVKLIKKVLEELNSEI